MKVLILGAGPTGLGAAWRLHQLGHTDWELWERDAIPGGLSRSEVDPQGFTWDMGGHILFSHYPAFDELMDDVLGRDGWLDHARESWVRIYGRWVPYPFQNNIHRLPPERALECFKGLLELDRHNDTHDYANFRELILGRLGKGIAEQFMLPYNFKVWAYPPEQLGVDWIRDRVAMPKLDQLAESIILGRDNVSWGPNNTFRFPKTGGTGAIWNALANRLPAEKIHYNRPATGIDPDRRVATANDGTTTDYDVLISTLPVNALVPMAGLTQLDHAASLLQSSAVHVIGIGLKGQPGLEMAGKNWIYFPEDTSPFYRVTLFSQYSPANVPDASAQWSLMAEVSESPAKPVNASRVVEETIAGLLNTGLIDHAGQVSHTFQRRVAPAYPTPGLRRDEALGQLLPALEGLGIYSRGRFGAWKYEVANQDHSLMQGVEVVNRLLRNEPETTLNHPEKANAGLARPKSDRT